ncbi:MAG: hypothetical protein AB8G18_03805 [Gammaproteobacteria bacterium]
MSRPADRDKLIMALCDRLIARSAAERHAFLEKLEAEDPGLRTAVEELLESIENSGEFMVLEDRSET